eukprot:COSAG02_NODE_4697_length_5084_cov_1.990572_5_plen_86_part_00
MCKRHCTPAQISTNTSDSMDIDDDIDWSDQWAAIGEVVHTADFLLYVSYIKSWEFLPGIFKSVLSVDNLTGKFLDNQIYCVAHNT